MASEIHKRRTGKSLRITEEIVMKEEMYEEEDDDLPRSYRVLGPNMQTASPDMNYRVEAYLSNKAAMSNMLARTNDEWRQNEVNKLFDQMFPNASFNPQRTAASSQSPQLQPQSQPQQRPQPQPHQMQHQHSQPQHSFQHQQQMPQQMQQMQQMQAQPNQFAAAQQYYGRPNAASPANHARAYSTPSIGHCPPPTDYTRQDSGIGMPNSPHHFVDQTSLPDSPIDLGSSRSAFTSELPAEAKMMMMGDGNAQAAFEQSLQNWSSIDGSFDMTMVPRGDDTAEDQLISPTGDVFDVANMKWDPMAQQMPPMDDNTWNTFINDNAWANDQQ